ncbi:NAD(P)-dependent oxidoreductase [Micromonospora marina]|uniref:NAD(P)-dependent oxidoreductase n=1 Tax=Micromonospora marina TaxID=307120 RepID=UPI0034516B1B
MNVALIGASGRTGRLVLDVLVRRGHQVTVLARDPDKLGTAADNPAIRVVPGDVRDMAALERLVDSNDIVISALGPSGKQTDLHTETAKALVIVMRAAGIRRFVGISGAGVDAPGDRKSGRDKAISWLINRLGGAVVKDKPAELVVWRDSGLDWTLVRPPRLMDTPATGRIEHDAHRSTKQTKISRADLATFIVDVAEQDRYRQAAPFVANV